MMKKTKQKIKLSKIEIARLQNPNKIYGGTGDVTGGNGTEGGQGGQQLPQCKAGSDIILSNNDDCPDH